MHRAHKFLDKLTEHALELMEKDPLLLKPRELDLIAACCDLHNEVCEFIEFREKFDGEWDETSEEHEDKTWGNPHPRMKRM